MCSGAVSSAVLLSQTGLLFTKGVQIAVLLVEVGLQKCLGVSSRGSVGVQCSVITLGV